MASVLIKQTLNEKTLCKPLNHIKEEAPLHTIAYNMSVYSRQDTTQKLNAFWSRCTSWVNIRVDSIPQPLEEGVSRSSVEFYGVMERRLRWLQRGYVMGILECRAGLPAIVQMSFVFLYLLPPAGQVVRMADVQVGIQWWGFSFTFFTAQSLFS